MVVGFLLNFPRFFLCCGIILQQTGFRLHWRRKALTEIPLYCPCLWLFVSSCLVVYGGRFLPLEENLWLYKNINFGRILNISNDFNKVVVSLSGIPNFSCLISPFTTLTSPGCLKNGWWETSEVWVRVYDEYSFLYILFYIPGRIILQICFELNVIQIYKNNHLLKM